MSGLYHDFFLVSRKEHDFSEYMTFINDPNSLKIHDDLIRYMLDAINWFPTYNPSKSETQAGLCLYGPTIIRDEGANTAAKVFRSYADLFSNGPQKLQLTGLWSVEEGKPFAEGSYQKIADTNGICGWYQNQEKQRMIRYYALFCEVTKPHGKAKTNHPCQSISVCPLRVKPTTQLSLMTRCFIETF
ncbi:MAG: hypothetical protein M3R15_28690 [Acidobacteriota bacterium]|nr:hypothetical protein [Acidobacteriota bacterium]